MKKQTILYLGLTFLFTWGFWFLLAYLSHQQITSINDTLGFILFFLGGFSATIMAYITVKLTKVETIKQFNKRIFSGLKQKRWVLFSLLVPVFLVLVAQGIHLVQNGNVSFALDSINFGMLPVFFISSIVFGGIEEIGWRGIVQHNLSSVKSLMILNLFIGIVWAFWHLPFFFIEGQAHYQTSFFIFLVSCIGYSSFLTYLYFKSKSVLLTIIFHTMINTLSGLGLILPFSEANSFAWFSIIMVVLGSALLLLQKKIGHENKYT